MSPENEQKRKLTKEEQQKIFLGIIMGAAVIYGAWQFGLKKIFDSRKAVEKEIAGLQKEYKDSKMLVDSVEKVEEDFQEQGDKLGKVISEQLPPGNDPMTWAARLLRETANSDAFSLRREGISEQGVERPRAGRDEYPPLFEDYRVRVEYTGGYHDLGRFLAEFEQRNSFFRVDSLGIGRHAKEDGKLRIELGCAFPRLTEEGFPPEERPGAPIPASAGEGTAK